MEMWQIFLGLLIIYIGGYLFIFIVIAFLCLFGHIFSSLLNDEDPEDTESEYPLESTEIVHKWTGAHPKKTRKGVLLEKFPKARMGYNGTPDCCAKVLGLCSEVENLAEVERIKKEHEKEEDYSGVSS